MSEMVNRAAQAASDAVLKNHQILMDNVAHTIARAVIEAMRVPTQAMCRAVANTCGDPEVVVVISASGAENVWRTMLNEALK